MNQTLLNQPDSLIQAAMQIMAARAGPPSVRDVAAQAQVSPSLIGYRFGGIDALLEAALAAGHEQEGRLWLRRQADYLVDGLTAEDLPGLMIELLVRDPSGSETLCVLRWLRTLRTVRGPSSTIHTPFLSEPETAFWHDLAIRVGFDHGRAELMHSFYHGAAFCQMVGAGQPGVHTWITAVTSRFCARLNGANPPGPDDCAYRLAWSKFEGVRTVDPAESAHPTRQRVLDAAVTLVLQEGASALTHRRIAAEAGASVSSVIHFFDTRRSILLEAYESLYRRMRDRSLGQLDAAPQSGPRLTSAQLASGLWSANPSEHRSTDVEVAGLLNAMFEASREPETKPLALAMVSRFGETSRMLLNRLENCRGSIGWLDAQVFRMVVTGQWMVAQTSGVRRREDLERALKVLFQAGP